MLIAILQFELLIHGATSIKDKRRIVSSLKDRLHREHLVAIAEIGMLDAMHVARLGLAAVGNDAKYLASLLDRITTKIRGFSVEAELGECVREIITNGVATEVLPPADGASSDPEDPSIAADKDHPASAQARQLASELLAYSEIDETADARTQPTTRHYDSPNA